MNKKIKLILFTITFSVLSSFASFAGTISSVIYDANNKMDAADVSYTPIDGYGKITIHHGNTLDCVPYMYLKSDENKVYKVKFDSLIKTNFMEENSTTFYVPYGHYETVGVPVIEMLNIDDASYIYNALTSKEWVKDNKFTFEWSSNHIISKLDFTVSEDSPEDSNRDAYDDFNTIVKMTYLDKTGEYQSFTADSINVFPFSDDDDTMPANDSHLGSGYIDPLTYDETLDPKIVAELESESAAKASREAYLEEHKDDWKIYGQYIGHDTWEYPDGSTDVYDPHNETWANGGPDEWAKENVVETTPEETSET